MATFYKACIAFRSETPEGKLITKKENILIEAISFTEAEVLAYQIYLEDINSDDKTLPKDWLKTNRVNDFEIKSLVPQEVEDIINENVTEIFFRGRVIIHDGEKKITKYCYIGSENLIDASSDLRSHLSTYACDSTIHSVITTNVNGIYKYSPERAERAKETAEKLKENTTENN